jgi:hypothetical protein
MHFTRCNSPFVSALSLSLAAFLLAFVATPGMAAPQSQNQSTELI